MAPSSGVTAPLAIDGTLYFSVGLSVIHAMDAATGEVLWRYDPEVHKVAGREMRGGWGVRGIAYSDGKVFSGTLDGRLIALDAAAGKLLWSAETTGDDDGRYITGMPYVMADKVIIGHGGADFAPVRGYVTAYDANSGEQLWRFYTVPGDPSKGFENEAMAMAAKTWNGEWWKHGGGGTVWHAMAYDPELDLVYIGTGNGAPWNRKIRSPGGGDNLFLASIIALEADSGKYVWHYQVNPGETWDFNANMDITLADLTVDGEARKVILHAPKNGFFYVIDRTNGTLISAESFAKATWAERIDTTSGRPIEVPGARYPEDTAFLMFPAAWGAHGVEAMSFNPRTGLVYLPARDKGNIYTDTDDLETWQFDRRMFISNGVGSPPADMTVPPGRGWLAAWDPLEQREVWRVDLQDTHNGGTLTTAGNLVMQGRATGEISVYAADTGEKLWSFDAQNGIMAQPITYLVDGRQHITLLVGWRGSTYEGPAGPWNYRTQKRRVLTFALDEEGQLPPVHDVSLPIVATPHFEVDEAKAVRGDALYHKTCFICHGGGLRAGGAAPDLIRSAVPTNLEALVDVVKHGSLKSRGMPQYQEFSEERIEGLLHYIRKTARERLQREQAPTSGGR
jgi:quinohemoprotein ethanol dehydrogenase